MPPRTTPLITYLYTRLRQNGISHIHGVPGDFTLKALDYIKPAGLKWIGCCNELNAGYAADGYSRIRGLGALFTTYGVGELSAINAVAGSFAEFVPVVHVVGTPGWDVQRKGLKVHHTLGDGRSRIFAEVAEKFSVASGNLIDVKKAPEVIDRVIEMALRESRPVYLEVPCDMVSREIDAERLDGYALKGNAKSDGKCEEEEAEKVLRLLYEAKKPLLLADRGDGVQHSIKDEINQFVRITGIPTLTMPSGGGMVDHSIQNYFGVHSGPVGQIDSLPFVQDADLIIAFGPLFSDTQTLGWKVVPESSKTVTIGKNCISYGQSPNSQPIRTNAKALMKSLIKNWNRNHIYQTDSTSLGDFRNIQPLPIDNSHKDSPIDQSSFYLRLNSYLKPNDIVLLGNATPILGGRDLVLPSGAQIIASGMWFSIGHMLPAALGAALAQQERDPHGRVVLIDGDGNVQVTVQEISTMIKERINITIFVINNGGYAYERQIWGMNESYNDLTDWKYLDAGRFFGGESAVRDGYSVDTFRIETWRDLEEFLRDEKANDGKGMKLVEVVVGKYDVPEKFKTVFKAAGERL